MPFTLAHPAALLPFKRYQGKLLSWSALIIGSMVPDFEAILLLDTRKIYGHSLEGMFTLDLPLGLLLWFVFFLVVRDPLVANLPDGLRTRLAQYRVNKCIRYFATHIPAVLLSLLAGVGTHLLWDSITHQNAWLPWLAKGIVTHGRYIEYYLMLQYLSSILGTVFVIVFVARLPKGKVKTRMRSHPVYWPLVLAGMILTVLLLDTYMVSTWQHPADFYINNILCGLTAGVTLASLLTRYFIKSI